MAFCGHYFIALDADGTIYESNPGAMILAFRGVLVFGV